MAIFQFYKVCVNFIFIYACESVSVCVLRTLHTILCKQLTWFYIISSATEMLSKLCICTPGITEEFLQNSTTQYYLLLHNSILFWLKIVALWFTYTHSLISSTYEKLHCSVPTLFIYEISSSFCIRDKLHYWCMHMYIHKNWPPQYLKTRMNFCHLWWYWSPCQSLHQCHVLSVLPETLRPSVLQQILKLKGQIKGLLSHWNEMWDGVYHKV